MWWHIIVTYVLQRGMRKHCTWRKWLSRGKFISSFRCPTRGISSYSMKNAVKLKALKEREDRIQKSDTHTQTHRHIALFPGPAQLFVASSTVKRERGWYLLSREWHQDRKDGRKGLIVHGHTRPRTMKTAKVPQGRRNRPGRTGFGLTTIWFFVAFFFRACAMRCGHMRTKASIMALSKQAVHRCRNQSGWSGHGRTILSRSWDIIMCSTFEWSRIAVVKFGRYVPKCARIRLTFSMTKFPSLRIPVWSWSAMKAPPHCLKYQGPNFCRALCTRIINSFTTNIKLGLTIQRLLPAALYLVTYYTYLARERRLSHTKRWVCSLLKTRETQPVSSCKFSPFSDYVMLCEKKYQALPAFPYCKNQSGITKNKWMQLAIRKYQVPYKVHATKCQLYSKK